MMFIFAIAVYSVSPFLQFILDINAKMGNSAKSFGTSTPIPISI
jgi:hypothetical protein